MRQRHLDFCKDTDVSLYDSRSLSCWGAMKDSPLLQTIGQFTKDRARRPTASGLAGCITAATGD